MTSCRACGGELEPITLCPACEENVQWKCESCSKETDTSIHTHGGIVIKPTGIAEYQTETSFAATA